MPAVAQHERAHLTILAVVVGVNTSFHRDNNGLLVGAHTSGDTTISFDGFSANAVILPGHTVDLDGVSYTVKSRVVSSASGVVTDMEITPALSTSPADNSEVVIGKTKTFYWSDAPFATDSGDTPADTIFEPFMDRVEFTSTMASGDSFGQEFEVDSGSVTIRGRELLGNERYLIDLEPYLFVGQAVQLYLVGSVDGSELDWSTKKTLLDGLCGDGPAWTPEGLTIPVRASGVDLLSRWHRIYTGLQEAPFMRNDLGAGNVDLYAPASMWDPGAASFTIMCWVYPEPSDFDSTTWWIVKKGHIELELTSTTISFSVDISSTTYTATVSWTPTFGRWYKVAAVCDRSAAVGYANGRIYVIVDGVEGTHVALVSGSLDSTSSNRMGFLNDGGAVAGTGSRGMICNISLHTVAKPTSDINTLLAGPLPGPQSMSNLLAYWPGWLNALRTIMFDIGPSYDEQASPTSPYDATGHTNLLRGNTMEGGDSGRGSKVTKGYGMVRNSSPFPLDTGTFIFQYHDGNCQGPSEVRDRGAAFTLGADYRLEEFLETTPGAGTVISCSQKGLLKFNALSDQRQITCDYGGRSGSPGGYRLRSASSQYKIFSTAHTAFNAPWSTLFWLTLYSNTTGMVIFDCNSGANQGWKLSYNLLGASAAESQRLKLEVEVSAGYTMTLYSSAVKVNEPHHFAIVCDEVDSDVTVDLYQDGLAVDSGRSVGVTLGHPAGDFHVGASLTPNNYADILLSEWSIHDAALTQATIRDLMFRYSMVDDAPSPSYAPDIAHYYSYRNDLSNINSNELRDWVGSKHSTTGTNGTWTGGVSIGSTLHAIYDLLTQAGVDHDDIDMTDAFDDVLMCGAPISAEPSNEVTVEEMVGVVKAGAMMQVVYLEDTWYIRRTDDPDDLTPVTTITQADFAGPLRYLSRELPPREIRVRWGLNPTVQDAGDLVGSVDDDLRNFVGLSERWAQECDAVNQEDFPSLGDSDDVLGVWRYEKDAVAEATRQMDLRGRKRPLPVYVEVPLMRSFIGDTTVRVGEAVTITHEDMPGPTNSRTMIIVSMSTNGRTGTLRCWG